MRIIYGVTDIEQKAALLFLGINVNTTKINSIPPGQFSTGAKSTLYATILIVRKCLTPPPHSLVVIQNRLMKHSCLRTFLDLDTVL